MTSPPRANRTVLAVVGIIIAGLLLYWLRGALFPFIAGGALAYVLHPVVCRIERFIPRRERWPALSRTLAIFLVYAGAIGLLAGALLLVIPPAFREAQDFVASVPDFIESARVTIEGWNTQYADMIPLEVRQQIEDALQDAGSILISAAQNVVARTFSAVSSALTVVIGLVVVPVFLYYLLKDSESLREGVVYLFPPSAQTHAHNVISILNRVFGSYVKAQLFLALVIGVLVFVGLFIVGISFSVWLGVVAGLFALVPIIGPWLGAIPGVLVTLATSPGDIVWVALVYLGVQLLENTLLAPRVHGHALDIHPLAIIIVLVVGSEVAGLWGVVLGPPLVAAAKEVFAYFRTWPPPEPRSQAEPALVETLVAEEVDPSDT